MDNRQTSLSQFFSGIKNKKRITREIDDDYVAPLSVTDSLTSRQRDLYGNILQNSALRVKRKSKSRLIRNNEKLIQEWEKNHLTRSILHAVKRPRAQEIARSQIRASLENIPSTPILIVSRDDGKIRGKAAHFDHWTVQAITQQPTRLINLPGLGDHLGEYVDNHVSEQLKGSEATKMGKVVPKVVSLPEMDGLLFVPGLPRDLKDSDDYLESERHLSNSKIIKRALLLGMPIIGVCGGSWEIWSQFAFRYDKNFNPTQMSELRPVRDHSWNQGMPSMNSSGNGIIRNVQVHAIKLTNSNSILRGALGYTEAMEAEKLLLVNSVHWQAPNENVMSKDLEITAIAKINPEFKARNRQALPFTPEENTVEAFETVSGAPVIGVMWHVEAYASDNDANARTHCKLLNYMQDAGTAFSQRRAMVKDLEAKFAAPGYKHALKELSLFRRDAEGNAISSKHEDDRREYLQAKKRK